MDNKIQIFEDKRIRTAWNEETEEWYYYKAIEILECEGNTKMSEKLRETLINSFIDILRCENQTIQRTARSRYIAVRNGT